MPRNGDATAAAWTICGLTNRVQPDGSTLWQIDGAQPVTGDEIREVREALRVLQEDDEQAQLNLVLANFQSIFAYMDRLPEAWEQALASAVNPVARLQNELATRLFNWLQGVRAYIDHTKVRLHRRYGEQSDEVKAFLEAASKEYDEVFAYRFFAKLRNYGHVGFPALQLERLERRPIGMPLEIRARVTFRRDTLLATYDEWGTTVRRDLEAQPENFDAIPLIVELMQCLDRLKAAVGLIEFETLANAVEVLDRLRERLGEGVEGAPTLVRIRERTDGSISGIDMIDIPPFELPPPDDDKPTRETAVLE